MTSILRFLDVEEPRGRRLLLVVPITDCLNNGNLAGHPSTNNPHTPTKYYCFLATTCPLKADSASCSPGLVYMTELNVGFVPYISWAFDIC